MGYYTYYTGKVLTDKTKEEAIANAIAKLDAFNDGENRQYKTIAEVIDFDSIKWYTCFSDMDEISKMFPDEIIMIHGEGEDKGDLWKAYFKNGKHVVHYAKIVYDEFDEKELEE